MKTANEVIWHRMVSRDLILGEAKTFEVKAKYKTKRQIKGFLLNVPSRNFVQILGFKANGVELLCGLPLDGFEFIILSQIYDMISLIVGDGATLTLKLRYTGEVPRPFTKEGEYQFIADFVTSGFDEH